MTFSAAFKWSLFIIFGFTLVIASLCLYKPLKYRFIEHRLLSPDSSIHKKTINTLARDGEKSIPFIKYCLRSNNDNLILAACEILNGMQDPCWELLLPELRQFLGALPSKVTLACISVVYNKCFNNNTWSVGARHFSDDPSVSRNFCIYILKYEGEDQDLDNARFYAAKALGEIGDPIATEFLNRSIREDPCPTVRLRAAGSLGEIGDSRAVKPLIRALRADTNNGVISAAARALGSIGNRVAMMPLIQTIEDNSDRCVLYCAIEALGRIQDSYAIEPLARILQDHSDPLVRMQSALAIGRIGNSCVLDLLIKAKETDLDNRVRSFSAIAIASLEIDNASEILQLGGGKGDNWGTITSKAWFSGGEYLKRAGKQNFKRDVMYDNILKTLLAAAKSRWGCMSELDVLLEDILELSLPNEKFYSLVLARMPAGFPEYDFQANYAARMRQILVLRKWLEKYKYHISWDSENQRYIIKNQMR